MQSTELKLETNIGKGANGNTSWKTIIVDATTVPKVGDRIAFINSTIHTLCSNCDLLFSNEIVHTSNNLYAQRPLLKQKCPTLKAAQHQIWLHKATVFKKVISDQHAARQTSTHAPDIKTLYGKMP